MKMYSLFQILILSIFLLLIAAKIKNELIYWTFAFLFSIYISLEAVALYTLGTPLDYQFYFHFDVKSLQNYGPLFLSEIFFVIALTVAFWIVFLYFRNFLSASLIRGNKALVSNITAIAALVFMAAPGGIIANKFEIEEILNAEETSFEEALNSLGIRPEDYVTKDELQAKGGKNVIVITLESLEGGFLGNSFQGVAPVLSDLANRWTYFDGLQQTAGSGWTSAAIYSYQVGMPAFFKGQGNSYFQNSRAAKLVGLGNILKKAGYNTRFLIGDGQFAGISDLMRVYEIPVVEAGSTIRNYPPTRYGLHDFDLFNEATAQLESLRRTSDKPFALFITTVDTHFPNGIYDERMERYVSSRDSKLEFTVSSVDYLLGEFLEHLKKVGLMESTTIFIFPDHLMMGGQITKKLDKTSRHLYLITNADKAKFSLGISEPFSLVNLPRMIVQGSEIETNATFLTDYIGTNDLSGYLSTHRRRLTALNHASLHRLNFRNYVKIYVKDKKLHIRSGEEEMIRNIDTDNLESVLDLTMNSEMSLIGAGWVRRAEAYLISERDLKYNRLHLMIFLSGGELEYVYIGDKDSIGLKKVGQELVFQEDDIASLLAQASQKEKQSRKQTLADDYSADARRFIAHAGGSIAGHSYTNSLEAMNLSYKKGFRLFELDIIKTADDFFVAAHDWRHWAKQAGFNGDEVPDLETFMSHKILGKYTPMDMDAINSWFASHTDAILVTDKTNEAARFSQQFVDKERLMMELFSWEAVSEGVQAGIRSAMPTDRLLRRFTSADVSALVERGITAVAMSRRFAEQDRALVESIVSAGVNIYAFHINFDEGKDESYVVCNENHYFFGLYADDWEIGRKVPCD